MNKTSKADFEYFKKRCEVYLDELSLRDWRIYYYHNDSDLEAYAWIRPDVSAKQACVGLTINWEDHKVTKDILDYCAKHEILHLLLADLVQCGKWRQSTDEDFTEAQHAVIRRLENAWN